MPGTHGRYQRRPLACGEPTFILDRTEAYTGILIDDLITKGTNEPYRMFTSRAEFRLHLRIDNADRRLTPHGRRLGLINHQAWADYEAKQARAVALEKLLATRKVNPEKLAQLLPEATALGSTQGQTYAQILKRPEVTIEALYPLIREELTTLEDQTIFADWLNPKPINKQLSSRAKRSEVEGPALPFPLSTFPFPLRSAQRNELKSVETEIKYSGYLDQQKKSIEKLKKAEQRTIPEWFDYKAVSGLSREMQEKLTRVRPSTIGQASRIPGVTPAALTLVNVYIEIQASSRAAQISC